MSKPPADPMHPAERGARPTTIRMRPDGAATLQRVATWRLPMEHPDMAYHDQLYAAGHLTPVGADGRPDTRTGVRLHANASALCRLWHAAGMAPKGQSAEYGHRISSGSSWAPESNDAEGVYHAEMRRLHRHHVQALENLLHGYIPRALLPTLCAALDCLDCLQREWAADTWADEG